MEETVLSEVPVSYEELERVAFVEFAEDNTKVLGILEKNIGLISSQIEDIVFQFTEDTVRLFCPSTYIFASWELSKELGYDLFDDAILNYYFTFTHLYYYHVDTIRRMLRRLGAYRKGKIVRMELGRKDDKYFLIFGVEQYISPHHIRPREYRFIFQMERLHRLEFVEKGLMDYEGLSNLENNVMDYWLKTGKYFKIALNNVDPIWDIMKEKRKRGGGLFLRISWSEYLDYIDLQIEDEYLRIHTSDYYVENIVMSGSGMVEYYNVDYVIPRDRVKYISIRGGMIPAMQGVDEERKSPLLIYAIQNGITTFNVLA